VEHTYLPIKLTGFYVGSSISLSNRLTTGYLGPKRVNRKIDLAITDAGLDSFNLDLYLLPHPPCWSMEGIHPTIPSREGDKFLV
jgi:hypothetical protein